jgi:hypothetical protein
MQYVEYIGKGEDEKWLPRPYKNRGEKGTKICNVSHSGAISRQYTSDKQCVTPNGLFRRM